MPVLDGIEATKKIVEFCTGKTKIPAILGLTGDLDQDVHLVASEAGMSQICNFYITL